MTLKSLNKKISLAAVGLLTATALGTAFVGTSVQAKEPSDQVSSGKVIINASTAAPTIGSAASTANGQTNNATTQTPDTTNQTNQGTTVNDGTTQSVTGTGVMANVTFSAQQIQPTSTADNAASTMDPNDKSTYTSVGTAQDQTTNAQGVATFDLTTNGYYLIHQVTTVGGVTEIKDFIVQVNSNDNQAGDLQVYPKMDLNSATNDGKPNTTGTTNTDSATNATDTAVVNAQTTNSDNINNPNATYAPNAKNDNVTDPNNGTSKATGNIIVNGTDTTATGTASDGGNTTTAGSGDTVTYNVNTTFDNSQVTNADGNTSPVAGATVDGNNLVGTYTITDVLPDGVTAPAATDIKVTDGQGTVLVNGTDYNAKVDGQTVTVTLTAAGQEKVKSDISKTSATNTATTLNVEIPTVVKDDTTGAQTDAPKTTVTNAYGIDLSNTDIAATTVNVGGVEFTKVDSSTNKAITTADAVFVLVQANSEDAAKALVEANADYFNNASAAAAPTKELSVTSPANASFVTDTAGNIVSATTDANGVATFDGLNLLDSTDKTADDTTTANNYYAVEVKAPQGYQLPSATTGSNVFSVKAALDPTTVADQTVANAKPFALPFTGGEGIAAILVIAAAAGGAAFVIRRRKNADEEAVK